MEDWFQMAKDYAKAEKKLKVEQWVGRIVVLFQR